MSNGNVEPVRPLTSRASRGSRATRKRGASGLMASVGRSGATGVWSQVSLSLTRADAVWQAVQGHATNGDDAVRVPFPARVARVVALRW